MRLQRPYIALLHDVIMAALSVPIALYLRVGESIWIDYPYWRQSMFLLAFVCLGVFMAMHLYRGLWQYASIRDLVAITKAVSLSVLLFMLISFMGTRLEGLPRSFFAINWLVLIGLLGGPRFIYRVLRDKNMLRMIGITPIQKRDTRVPVLLVGINDNSELFLRHCAQNSRSDYKVVAVVDNNKHLAGGYIHNVKIYGNEQAVAKVVRKLRKTGRAPQRIIYSHEYPDGEYIRSLLHTAETLGLTVAKLPKLSDFRAHSEKVEVKSIAIEDLLGRPPQSPKLGRRKGLIEGKCILVTGAGGTIGSELCRQIVRYQPGRLICLDHSEYHLYAIDQELAVQAPECKRRAVLCDVRDRHALHKVFNDEKPDMVFHAAALKHVPIAEENPIEAILTNVFGTKNIVDLCLGHKIPRMVLISTDKAVNPSSVMGMTKRVAELYVHGVGGSPNNQSTLFSVVRFGNVLGSSGSVIPLFQQQIARGGPITVTHPEMTRYFMMVQEAVELVLRASTLTPRQTKSAIFVLNMGTPVSIKELALQMIKLTGLRPEVDIKIEYMGIRPGEKLYEELFYEHEKREKTLYEDIVRARPKEVECPALIEALNVIYEACTLRKQSEAMAGIFAWVPEYNAFQQEKYDATQN